MKVGTSSPLMYSAALYRNDKDCVAARHHQRHVEHAVTG